jgi:hypothetical protein
MLRRNDTNWPSLTMSAATTDMLSLYEDIPFHPLYFNGNEIIFKAFPVRQVDGI